MSAIDDLTTVPDQPQISEGNKTFSQKTFALWLWIRTKLVPAMVELRDLIVNSVTGAFSGTSTSTVTIVDTGEVSIMIESGLAFRPGTPVRLAYVTDPRIYIDGITKTYNDSTGAFAFYAQAKAGTGTYTNWSLSIIPSGGGLAGLGSNTFTGAQYVPDDAYDASGWNGSAAVPTKNAIRDKIESIVNALFGLESTSTDGSLVSNAGDKAASTNWVKAIIARPKVTLDQSGARSLTTTYTNTTGDDIVVSVGVTTTVQNGNLEFLVDGMRVFFLNIGNNLSGVAMSCVITVPNGSTYRANSPSSTLNYWREAKL